MRKKGRRAGMSSSSGHTVRGPDGSKAGNRGRPRKMFTTVNSSLDPSVTSGEIASLDTSRRTIDNAQRYPPDNRRQPLGRLPTALCRLCHGKFSPRSLRPAFNKRPRDLVEVPDDDESDPSGQSPLLFHTDFQSLVGVPVCRDPRLSEFICKKCHDNFYKCHSILLRFLQRVNLLPLGNDTNTVQKGAKCSQLHVDPDSVVMSSITSDPEGLHRLVSWAHYHGEACRSCPDLKEVLEGECWGSVRAVWGCVDGHSYVMDAQQHGGIHAGRHGNSGHSEATSRGQSVGGGHDDDEEEEVEEEDDDEGEESRACPQAPGSRTAGLVQTGLNHIGPAATTQPTLSSTTTDRSMDNSEVYLGGDESPSPAMQPEDRSADSDLSERELSIEDDFENSGKRNILDDELFEPYPEKRPRRQTLSNKKRRTPKSPEEPRVKKKPGPKPGWKNKFKSKGEELPNIYKCPYHGCTAVYRAPDGLKKHIKEHHEEVRERPCPHPGCNKVFMIDRYLQRHIKLIHTEERNYICDQCGQTFKQRKHLSVHQMRHSGAKPLQCEVCGFQCRQRASLKYHMTKHKAEADLEFACVLCGKRFEKAHNLNVHMSMVHPLTQGEGQRAAAPPQQHNSLYSEVHTITVCGEVVQQEQDR